MERGTMRRVFNEHKQGLRGGGVVGRNPKRVRRGDRQASPNANRMSGILEREELVERLGTGELEKRLGPWMKGGEAIAGFRPGHNPSQTAPEVDADQFRAPNNKTPVRKPWHALPPQNGRTIETDRARPPNMEETPSRTQADMQKEPSARPGPTSYWTVSEQTDLPRHIAHFGKDWEAIAVHMGTKTPTMVKNQYLRLIEGGNNDLQRVAEEADKRHSMGIPRGMPPVPSRVKRRYKINGSENIFREFLGDRKSEEVGISSSSPHLLSMSDKRFPNADDLKGAATNSESPPPTPSQPNKSLRRGSPELELPSSTRGLNKNTTLREMEPSRHGSIKAQNSTSQHLPRSGKRRQAKREERADVAAYKTSSRMRQDGKQAVLDSTVAAEKGMLGLMLSEIDAWSRPHYESFFEKPIRISNLDKSTTLSSNCKDSGLYMRYTISQDASMKTSNPFQGTLNSVLDRKRKFRQE